MRVHFLCPTLNQLSWVPLPGRSSLPSFGFLDTSDVRPFPAIIFPLTAQSQSSSTAVCEPVLGTLYYPPISLALQPKDEAVS